MFISNYNNLKFYDKLDIYSVVTDQINYAKDGIPKANITLGNIYIELQSPPIEEKNRPDIKVKGGTLYHVKGEKMYLVTNRYLDSLPIERDIFKDGIFKLRGFQINIVSKIP